MWEKVGLFVYDNAAGLPGITDLTVLLQTNREGIDFQICPDLVALRFPNLTAITEGGYLIITGCTSLQTISLPLLQTVPTGNGNLDIDSNPALTSVDLSGLASLNGGAGDAGVFNNNDALVNLAFPSLVSVVNTLQCGGNAVLQSLAFPVLTTWTGGFGLNANTNPALETIDISALITYNVASFSANACALNVATVNAILAKFVALGKGAGFTINLSGGTSAAPAGQGADDKTTLIAAGATVTTN